MTDRRRELVVVELTRAEIRALLWHAEEAELCRGWDSPPLDRPISTARVKLRYAEANGFQCEHSHARYDAASNTLWCPRCCDDV